jgi:hypothetical protein
MAPLPVIADCRRVSLNWSYGIQLRATNVIHLAGVEPLDDVFTALQESVVSDLWACVSDTAKVDSVDIIPLDGSSAGSHYVTDTSTDGRWKGGVSGECIPAVCALVKMTTAFRGRSNRGRAFLPFVGESAQNAGLMNATEVSNGNTAWADFLEAMAANASPLCVASYKNSSFHLVTTAEVEPIAATQRRRQSQLR